MVLHLRGLQSYEVRSFTLFFNFLCAMEVFSFLVVNTFIWCSHKWTGTAISHWFNLFHELPFPVCQGCESAGPRLMVLSASLTLLGHCPALFNCSYLFRDAVFHHSVACPLLSFVLSYASFCPLKPDFIGLHLLLGMPSSVVELTELVFKQRYITLEPFL